MPTKRQLAVIHIAKAQLCLPDDEYRTILQSVGNVESAKMLTDDGFNAVMGYFEYLGFKPLASSGKHYGARKGMATPAQVQLIRDLWREYQGAFDEKALDKWLTRVFGVGSLRFVDTAFAGKVIGALRSMNTRNRNAKVTKLKS